MTQQQFQQALTDSAELIAEMTQAAHSLHDHVNQLYDGKLPYWFHLDLVTTQVMRYGAEVVQGPADVPAVIMGAMYHDSIEDARLTYNNVLKQGRQWLDEPHALMAAEIVYALTNEKGRTRAERANDRYYAGIRATPYAPLVKMADRLANLLYSAGKCNEANSSMLQIYSREMPHFIEAITTTSEDSRLQVPAAMINKALELCI